MLIITPQDEAGRMGREKALGKRLFVRVVPLLREGAQPDHLSENELHELLD